MTTRTSTYLRWRTDIPTNSRVRFGLNAGNLNRQAVDLDMVTEHSVLVPNLTANTRYYYAIGTADADLAGGSEFYFTTAPNHTKPTRIWALGDCGTAGVGDTGSALVRDAYYNYAGGRETDVLLLLGDNAYGVGTDYEYQLAIFDIYTSLLRHTPVWSTIGNHETYAPNQDGTLSYFNIFGFPTQGEAGGIASGTENYYSFDYGNIHFVSLDSELSGRGPGSPMLQWLEADLDANTNEWTIAFWHSPPYTKGSHDSDSLFDNGGNMSQMRANVNPLLESYGVDLVLCGHSHNYERSKLLNGHYGFSWELNPFMILDAGSGQTNDSGAYLKNYTGPNANLGTVYIVDGSSGWATFQTGFHPVMHKAILQRGSVVIDVADKRMDVRFLRDTGSVDDYFTILKGAPAEPLHLTTIQVADGIVSAQWKSEHGKTYRIEKSYDLPADTWLPASDEIVATGATSTWADLVVPGDEKCFYRVALISQ